MDERFYVTATMALLLALTYDRGSDRAVDLRPPGSAAAVAEAASPVEAAGSTVLTLSLQTAEEQIDVPSLVTDDMRDEITVQCVC